MSLDVGVNCNVYVDEKRSSSRIPALLMLIIEQIMLTKSNKPQARLWLVDAHHPLRPADCRATTAPSQPRPLPTVARVVTRSQPQLRRPYKTRTSVAQTDASDFNA